MTAFSTGLSTPVFPAAGSDMALVETAVFVPLVTFFTTRDHVVPALNPVINVVSSDCAALLHTTQIPAEIVVA